MQLAARERYTITVFQVITVFPAYDHTNNTIQYNTIQYNTIQYNTIQYNTIQYNTIQYNTIKLKCNFRLIACTCLIHLVLAVQDRTTRLDFYIKN